MIVCQCFGITDSQVKDGEAGKAGTDCGGCVPALQLIELPMRCGHCTTPIGNYPALCKCGHSDSPVLCVPCTKKANRYCLWQIREDLK